MFVRRTICATNLCQTQRLRTRIGKGHAQPHRNELFSRQARRHAICLRWLARFFLYRDSGISEATNGKVIAHLVKANMAPETGTGWHKHEADFQIVIRTKGWTKFMYEDKETLVDAGDVVTTGAYIASAAHGFSPKRNGPP